MVVEILEIPLKPIVYIALGAHSSLMVVVLEQV